MTLSHSKSTPLQHPYAISFNGGKDCNLSLSICHKTLSKRPSILVTFGPIAQERKFRAHPWYEIQRLAELLDVKLVYKCIVGPSYEDSYVKAIQELHEEHGIKTLVTGDIDYVGKMDYNWISRCCDKTGTVEAYHPLWHRDRMEMWQMMREWKIVISCVQSKWAREFGFCAGQVVDEELLRKMQKIHDETQGAFDVAGEQGEYHTMVLWQPLYREEMTWDISRITEEDDFQFIVSGEVSEHTE